MGKVTLEFDSVEEQEDIYCALNGYKYKLAFWDLDNELRGLTKHAPDDMSSDTYDAYDRVREMIRQILGDYNLNME
jgi:hypothetical protein